MDFAYDVLDHTAIDPTYGTLDDLDRLVADVHRLMRWFRRQIDAYPGRVVIGEVDYGSSVERLARFYGDRDELHLALDFSLMTLPWESAVIADHPSRYDVARQRDDERSIVTLYRRLVALRRGDAVFTRAPAAANEKSTRSPRTRTCYRPALEAIRHDV